MADVIAGHQGRAAVPKATFPGDRIPAPLPTDRGSAEVTSAPRRCPVPRVRGGRAQHLWRTARDAATCRLYTAPDMCGLPDVAKVVVTIRPEALIRG
jgi:hypothetical protein